MTIKTRDFGEITVADSEVLEFARPIYGFEQLRRFVLLSDEGVGKDLVWLQSIEDEEICFILVNPLISVPSYAPHISGDVQIALGKGGLVPWCIAIIAADFKESTLNLKSPIIINPFTKLAAQIVLEEEYPIRQRILPQDTGVN